MTKPPPLAQLQRELQVATTGRGFYDITRQIDDWIEDIGAGDGLMTVFLRHTSASLTIQENADPAVRADLQDALEKLAPTGNAYRHSQEGPDDMPAHIRTMLTSVSLSIPVIARRSALGTWQGVFLIEHRLAPHMRRVTLHYMGTLASE